MKNMKIPILIMMVGLPGSGKTDLAHKLASKLNAKVFSSDMVRAEVCGTSYSPQDNQRVFPILYERIKNALADRQSVICDATNVRARDRKKFLKFIQGVSCMKICVELRISASACLVRNAARDFPVPRDAILRMETRRTLPQYDEGWDHICTVSRFCRTVDVCGIVKETQRECIRFYKKLWMKKCRETLCTLWRRR